MTRDTGVNSLGFAKAPQDTRVVVAMSGGVDSSVVAAQLALMEELGISESAAIIRSVRPLSGKVVPGNGVDSSPSPSKLVSNWVGCA